MFRAWLECINLQRTMILRSLLNMTLLQYMKLYQQSTMYSGLQRTFRIIKHKGAWQENKIIVQI